MIWTLLGIGLLIVGGILLYVECKTYIDACFYTGVVTFISGLIIAIICILNLIGGHCAVDKSIYDAELEYNALIKQVEAVNSEYEDVSKATVINRVYRWNSGVYSKKYWAENPWTNWFYDKDYVNSLKYIDMEDDNAEEKTQTWMSPQD